MRWWIFYKLVLLVAILVGLLGFIAPALISMTSDILVVIGVLALIGIVPVTIVGIIKNAQELAKDGTRKTDF